MLTHTRRQNPALPTNKFLLERNETRGVSSSNTRSTVLDGLVRDGEFGEVVSDHLSFDFNRVESFTVVNADNASNHLWHNKHVSEMGFDDCWFFIRGSFLSGFPQFLDQSHGFSLQSTLETSSCTSVNDLHELLIAEIEEGFEFDPSVLKFTEGSSFLEVGSLLGVGEFNSRHDGTVR